VGTSSIEDEGGGVMLVALMVALFVTSVGPGLALSATSVVLGLWGLVATIYYGRKP